MRTTTVLYCARLDNYQARLISLIAPVSSPWGEPVIHLPSQGESRTGARAPYNYRGPHVCLCQNFSSMCTHVWVAFFLILNCAIAQRNVPNLCDVQLMIDLWSVERARVPLTISLLYEKARHLFHHARITGECFQGHLISLLIQHLNTNSWFIPFNTLPTLPVHLSTLSRTINSATVCLERELKNAIVNRMLISSYKRWCNHMC